MDDENKIISLHRNYPAKDLISTLRKIIDQLERGDYGTITTGIIVLGHTSEKPGEKPGEREMSCDYETFAAGPRCDILTVRGLLATALRKL